METIIAIAAVLGIFGFFAGVLEWAARQSAAARQVVQRNRAVARSDVPTLQAAE